MRLPPEWGIDKLWAMVRPFDLRDLALIHRLDDRRVPLHTMSALAENFRPLRGAIVSMLVGGEFLTYVWKTENSDRAGFIQLRIPNGANQAYVSFISPGCEWNCEGDGSPGKNSSGDLALQNPDCAIWLDLLDEAVAGVGQRGIHHVIAEADERNPEIQMLLRRAGFAAYTRQDVWTVSATDYRPQGMTGHLLSRRGQVDEWDIQLLYANTVPRLVQLVEPLPSANDSEGWVVRDGNELAAFISIRHGAIATWTRLFIHPDAETEADKIVAAAMDISFNGKPDRVYCCVRRYESWLTAALEKRGFTVCGSQAVMVRHTVHHVSRAIPEAALSIEGQRVSTSSPFVRNFQQPEHNGKQ